MNFNTKKMNKHIIIGAFITVSLSGLGACDDMNSINQKYLDEGERIYIGVPDSLTVKPGNQRAIVAWKIDADPKLKDCIVSWGTGDSIIFPIERTNNDPQWLEGEIKNLPEKSLIFTAYTRDIYGNTSIRKEKSQMIYGPHYIALQSARKIASMMAYSMNRLEMTWYTLDNCVGVNMHYMNRNNQMVDVHIDALQTQVILTDFVLEGKFTYETLYKPEANSIDIFETISKEGVFPSYYTYDRSGWSIEASDYSTQEGGKAEVLLDNDYNTYWHSNYSPAHPLPHTITIDMKEVNNVIEVQVYKRLQNTDCKKVEISISMDDQTYTPIGSIEFEKTATPNGKSLVLDSSVKARYIRCNITQSHRDPHASLSEIKVLGK